MSANDSSGVGGEPDVGSTGGNAGEPADDERTQLIRRPPAGPARPPESGPPGPPRPAGPAGPAWAPPGQHYPSPSYPSAPYPPQPSYPTGPYPPRPSGPPTVWPGPGRPDAGPGQAYSPARSSPSPGPAAGPGYGPAPGPYAGPHPYGAPPGAPNSYGAPPPYVGPPGGPARAAGDSAPTHGVPTASRRSLLVGTGVAVVAAAAGATWYAVAGPNPRPSPAGDGYATSSTSGTELGPLADIPEDGGTVFDDREIVVTRGTGNTVHGFSAVCTHQGCLVSRVGQGEITCPCHGSAFDATTGAVIRGPAQRPLPAVPVKVVNGTVVTG